MCILETTIVTIVFIGSLYGSAMKEGAISSFSQTCLLIFLNTVNSSGLLKFVHYSRSTHKPYSNQAPYKRGPYNELVSV